MAGGQTYERLRNQCIAGAPRSAQVERHQAEGDRVDIAAALGITIAWSPAI
jgi:hypothetical protein